jgi:hypothetical protein
VISRALGGRIEREFKEDTDNKSNKENKPSKSVWVASFSDVRLKLNECMRICSKWKESMSRISRQPRQGGKWQGKYVDRYLEMVINRMHEIFELRSQHDELLRLLSSEEQKEMKVESFFDPFRQPELVSSFAVNEALVAPWKRARK